MNIFGWVNLIPQFTAYKSIALFLRLKKKKQSVTAKTDCFCSFGICIEKYIDWEKMNKYTQ